MKKRCFACQYLMVVMSMVGVAHAGSHNWSGFYIGADAGVAFNNAELTSQQLAFTSPSGTCDLSADHATFFPGVQLGYMYQFTNLWVLGIEVNSTFNTNQQQTLTCRSEFNRDVYDAFTFYNQTQTSIKGRIAHAVNWDKSTLIPYITAGASFAHLGLAYENEGGNQYSDTTTDTGWLIGLGLEWAFLEHWSLRAEYNYMDYGDAINLNLPTLYGLYDKNGEGQINLKSNTIAVAINYWI